MLATLQTYREDFYNIIIAKVPNQLEAINGLLFTKKGFYQNPNFFVGIATEKYSKEADLKFSFEKLVFFKLISL